MAKIITQETFDDVVKENIIDFSMSVAESRIETIEQFEAQGINLGNIIKDLDINEETGLPLITECLQRLNGHIGGDAPISAEDLQINLDTLKTECDKSVPHRVLAAKNGSHEILLALVNLELAKGEGVDRKTLNKLLAAINALINKQPDIFIPETLIIIMKIFESETAPDLVRLCLAIVSRACIMHEINRQNIMNAGILKFLKPLIHHDESETVRRMCTVFRALVLDDDVRVEFGKAHDHAKAIAVEVLPDLTALLQKFKDNTGLQADLMITIASLTVRNEYCLVVEEAGGLKYVLEGMRIHSDNERVIREGFQLLKALAGNDVVKSRIIEHGAAPLITDVLCIHKGSEPVAKSGLMCIATLTLRSKENSAALFATSISDEIVESMRLHTSSKAVLRNGAWAIRNMVSRSREMCDSFTKLGVEEVLNDGMVAHPSILQDLKSALRDLGCSVQLKEEWTGTSTVKMAN